MLLCTVNGTAHSFDVRDLLFKIISCRWLGQFREECFLDTTVYLVCLLNTLVMKERERQTEREREKERDRQRWEREWERHTHTHRQTDRDGREREGGGERVRGGERQRERWERETGRERVFYTYIYYPTRTHVVYTAEPYESLILLLMNPQ